MECKLENITIHYETFGQGIPIIVLHGWPADHRQAVDALETIFIQRTGWKRIYPDLPGMGQTSGANWINGSDEMLEVLTMFADQVIPNQRFALAGVSYGGYLVRGLIHQHPARIIGALLIVPVLMTDPEKEIKPAHIILVKDTGFAAALEHLDPDIAQGLLDVIIVQDRKILTDPWVKTYISEAANLVDYEFLARIGKNYAFSFDLDNPSDPYFAPMLFVLGRQDAMGYPKSMNFIQNYPRASFVILDRAGHALWMEQAVLYQALVKEWLDRVEEWLISED